MLNQIRAEWTKLRSTASFWWTSGVMIALGAMYGALFAWTSQLGGMPYIPLAVVASVALTTAIVVVVQQSMIVTTEYRFGIPATNFRLRPQRWQVAVAKLLLGAVLVALLTVVTLVVAFTVGDLTAAVSADWTSNPATKRALWALPLGMALLTMFVQGVGWLVRNTAGSVVIGLAMMLVIEAIAGLVPKIGQDLVSYLPFNNLLAFMTNQPTAYWELGTSLGIFAAWAVAAWVAGVVALHLRDA
ncbi:ABC transporter permease [Corynebacterium aquatimens]|uniref:ABC transporter permease n=1 Tax=Corynebacterium TaxID=1716 RepID=UPI001F3E4D0B|nr:MULTISPECIES: ABC transporter permease [Corynebacterium]QYH19179.1 ABC transporter permease [Corynebacterium aquatimens]UIZ91939.1 ABC transporter permease [Corynebacterium sp. CNCTC7651]